MPGTNRFSIPLSLAALVCLLTTGSARERQSLSGHVPEPARRLSPLGRLPGTNQLSLAISLPWRNPVELEKLLEQIYNPASPSFRHYLSPEEFAQRFGPAPEDYQAVERFCQTNGLAVSHRFANRAVLEVTAPVEAIERAFHTTLQLYPHPTEARNFYAPTTEPSLDLAIPILHIQGLDSLHRPQPLMRRINGARFVSNVGSGTNGSFLGKDFRAAYAPGVTLTGAGQAVALVEFDGYFTNDIVSYEKRAGLAAVPLQNVLVGGYNGRAGSGNGEVSLDIQMAIAMAPGLQKVVVYEAGSASPPNTLLNKIASDHLANQISCSWTWGTYDPGTDQIFQQFAALGQSFLQASGDNAAYAGAIDAPADNPYLTSVGGTTLSTSGQGVWVSETVWNEGTGTGTGGGYSTLYGLPYWQAGIDMTANFGSTRQRNIPDVALVADNVENISDNGHVYQITGTSIGAPLWAGFIALANQQAAASGLPNLGWLNPALYALGRSTNYPRAFHDTTTGDNTSPYNPNNFYATANYDLCTGWGTPTGSNTINLLLQVANNQIDHFAWGTVDSPLSVGTPLAVTVTARTLSNTVATSFTGSASLSALQAQTNLLFSRDFETGSLGDWTSEGGAYTRSIDPGAGAAGTKQSLTLIGGDSLNSYNGLSHTLPNLSPDRMDFYVKSVTNTTASGYLVAGAAKYRTNSVFHFRLDSTGVMGLTDGPGNFYATPYAGNQWYHIRLQFNWSAKTIDYYVDDSLVWPNIPFCNRGLSSLAVMNLYNFDDTQAWWDQISLTKNTRTVLAVTPGVTANFANGTWSGSLTLSQSATNLTLLASDNAGHSGFSSPFDAAAATVPTVTVTVLANPSQGGTVTGGGDYPAGSQQTIAAVPAANWSFTRWQDGNTTSPRLIVVPSTNVSFTAVFVEPPRIIAQPASLIVSPGQSATFTLVVAGSEPLLYQWLRDGTAVSGATISSYTLADVQPPDSGSRFSCLVSNPGGSITSQSAKLTVPPLFSSAGAAWANHQFSAFFATDSGADYLIQVSTNLLDWTVLNSLHATNTLAGFTDTNATVPYRFYRLSGVP